MEPGIQSSFIPKDATAPSVVPRARASGGLAEVLFLIAIVLLVASAALAGAVFLYKEYVQSSASSKLDQLARAKDAFEPSLIQELTRLDDRMRAAETLLQNHVAPTALFSALEQSTLATIAFQSFIFSAPDPQHMTLKMTGVAKGVNSIALEGDIFSKNGIIANPIFSDISRQNDGVHFTLTAQVNPSSLSFVQLAGALQSLQPSVPPSVFTPAATGTTGTSSAGFPGLSQ